MKSLTYACAVHREAADNGTEFAGKIEGNQTPETRRHFRGTPGMAAAVATAHHDNETLHGHHEGHHYIGGEEGSEDREKFSLMSLNNAKKKPSLKNAADPVETFIKHFQASTEALDLNEGGETIDSVFQVRARATSAGARL